MSPTPDSSSLGPYADKAGVQIDRRDHHLLVDELLEAVQDRLTPLRCIEAVRVPGLGEQLLRPGGIVRVAGRLPVELEAARNDAPGDPGVAESVGLIDRLPVDGVVRSQAHATIVPG